MTKMLIAILIVALCGCSTLGLVGKKDVTPEERKAALCLDARAMLAMSSAAIDGKSALSPELQVYWAGAKASAQVGIALYCITDPVVAGAQR